jgi:hypothetical protein
LSKVLVLGYFHKKEKDDAKAPLEPVDTPPPPAHAKPRYTKPTTSVGDKEQLIDKEDEEEISLTLRMLLGTARTKTLILSQKIY